MKKALSIVMPLLVVLGTSAQHSGSLRFTRSMPLPGVNGRLDHLAFDAQRQRLYLAACGNNTVEVVDVATGKVMRPLSIKDPHDLLVLPKPNLLYVTSGVDGCVKVFDCAAERAIKTIGPLPNARSLRLDAPANRVYVAFDSALGLLNVQTGVHTVTTPLPGPPEAFVIEPTGERIFVNVPGAKQVAVVERLSREVVATWPLGETAGNHALALDEVGARLFVGCRQPPRLLVLDTQSGKAVAECGLAAEVGGLFFDAKRKRLYASCGEGFLEVFDQASADQYKPEPRLPTAKGASTSLLVAESDSLFLAVPAQGGKPAEVRVYRLGP